jgi:phosphatidate phosphatase PAH1
MRWVVAASLLFVVAACGPSGGGTPSTPAQAGPGAPPVARTAWRHKRSSIVEGTGRPGHSSNDVVVNPGTAAIVEGKFAYGKLSKDLEDEDVSLWMMAGEQWKRIGDARTDDDGRARFSIPPEAIAAVGPHRYRIVVHGDLSDCGGIVWVVAPKAGVVVFDIDGTLTSGGFTKMHFTGTRLVPRPSAAALTHRWVAAGYLPIYLTARPYLYNVYSRAWLAQHGFANGPVLHSDKVGDSLPGHSHAGKFKIGALRRLIQDTSIAVAAAYGDQDSDACAFLHAGVDPNVTYIWGKERRSCDGNASAQAIEDYGDAHALPILAP